jgi:hypothetical protein
MGYVVEFSNGVKYSFRTFKEANSFKEAMMYKFATHAQCYPSEPEVKEVAPQVYICDVCGVNPAESGDFTCMECYSRMLLEEDK